MIKNSLIFIFTSVLVFIIIEIYLTQTEIMQPLTGEVDKHLGFIYSPSQDFVMFNEGFCISSINSFGFIGKEYPQKKAPNTYRITLLGDSYVQGLQVFERYHFSTIFESELKKSNINIEVLNFGVAGHNLSDMYCYYQNKVVKFQPDLTLFFICENDLKEKTITEKRNELYPYAEIQNDSLIINYDFTKNVKYKIYSNTKFLFNLSFGRLVNKMYINIQKKQAFSILFDKFYFSKTKQQISQKKEIDITNTTELIFEELKKQEIIIVYRDTINQEINDFITTKIGIQKIDLNDTLNILKQNNEKPNYWKITKQNGHWNHKGHKAVGEFLSNKITNIIDEMDF